MLQLKILPEECYDEDRECFYSAYPWAPKTPVDSNKPFVLLLEHSLLSLSRWEEKWKVPFLVDEPAKTTDQVLDYIRLMTLTKNVPTEVYKTLTQDQINTIIEYIEDSHTATWFSDEPDFAKSNGPTKKTSNVITAEIIYYWMIAQQIPWDPAERWHLNKLLTLIRVCSIKNAPPKKKNQKELRNEFARAKAARRAARNKK